VGLNFLWFHYFYGLIRNIYLLLTSYMALVPCKFCGAKISERALNCPKCEKSTQIAKINIFQAYRNFWFRAFDIRGICGRREFWLGYIFAVIVNIIFILLFNLINDLIFWDSSIYVEEVTLLQSLATLVQIFFIISVWTSPFPLFTSTIRRFRDTKTNPWFIFLNMIPIVGQIYTFKICLRGSKKWLWWCWFQLIFTY